MHTNEGFFFNMPQNKISYQISKATGELQQSKNQGDYNNQKFKGDFNN